MTTPDPIPGAPNFTYQELTFSQTVEALGLGNAPDCAAEARLVHIAQEVAQPAREALGPIVVSSGYRSPALNRLLGGADKSAHLLGAALDLVPRRVSVAALALWLVFNLGEWDQVIYERRRGRAWVHVALWPPRERPNRGELRRHLPQDGASYPFITRTALELWAVTNS